MERNNTDTMALEETGTPPDIDYTAELIRKGIHLCSLSIPILYCFMSKSMALSLLVPMTAAFLTVDVLRYFHQPTATFFYRWFRKLLRHHEINGKTRTLNGATYVLLSATLCVLIFPKMIVITSFAILIISDSAAALIGRRFGKHKFYHKSLEGSGAFLICAIIVVFCTPKIEYVPMEYFIGIIGGFVGMIAEIASFNIIDDNVAIPLSIGGIMWLLYRILLPLVNIYTLDQIL
jgi:dolichol kinase